MKKNNIAVVGATGLVGRTMLSILEQRKFPYNTITLLASKKTAGQIVKYAGEDYIVKELTENSFENIDIALFSAGSYVSEKYAPIAAKAGCIVVDNGSYWRQNKEVPLVVPEVNPEDISWHKNIIANPNCSTIQLMLPLKALDDIFGLERVICSTYQSISGAGQSGLDKLENELNGNSTDDNHKIANNIMFHTPDDDSGFSFEEQKMFMETRKILHNSKLNLAFTCVRLPIIGGHCESVNLELENDFTISEVKKVLQDFDGITVVDDLNKEMYATPENVAGKDDVFISRIRRDDSTKNGLYLWVVADNLRKGAALNAVQIAEKLIV